MHTARTPVTLAVIVAAWGAATLSLRAAPPGAIDAEIEARLAEYRAEMSLARERDRLRAQREQARIEREVRHRERQAARQDLLAASEVETAPVSRQAALGGFKFDCAATADIAFGMLSPQQETAPGDASSAGGSSSEDLAKKLQNPVASLISVPFQFNWDTGIGANDADRLLLNVQPVVPFSLNDDWNLISRTIIPVVYAESPMTGISSELGLGDITPSFFFSPKEPVNDWIIGFGPVLQIPTGTDDLFRSKQFSMGPTGLLLQQKDGWTYGILANHLWRVAGDDEFPDVNNTFLQPFISHTWKGGFTLALNSESSYNWTASEWTVPLNLTLSQLVHFGDQPVQFQFGGRYYAHTPDGGPDWGIRFVIIFLFPK